MFARYNCTDEGGFVLAETSLKYYRAASFPLSTSALGCAPRVASPSPSRCPREASRSPPSRRPDRCAARAGGAKRRRVCHPNPLRRWHHQLLWRSGSPRRSGAWKPTVGSNLNVERRRQRPRSRPLPQRLLQSQRHSWPPPSAHLRLPSTRPRLPSLQRPPCRRRRPSPSHHWPRSPPLHPQ